MLTLFHGHSLKGRNLALTVNAVLQTLHGYEGIRVSGMKTHDLTCVSTRGTLLCLTNKSFHSGQQERTEWFPAQLC